MKSTFRANNDDPVIEFLNRRFPLEKDCNWVDGNCYYMAAILKSRFPQGDVFYDTIMGHFLFKYNEKFYDFSGEVDVDIDHGAMWHIIEWRNFEYYDETQKACIERDCIM